LVAADLFRTTTQSIRLPIADITEAGIRIGWSALTRGNAQMLAANLAVAAIERLAFPAEAGFAAAAGVTAGATVVVVCLGIDTLIAALGFIRVALTLSVNTVMAVRTGMATGATIARISQKADAVLIAARCAGETAARIRATLTLLQFIPLNAREFATGKTSQIEVAMLVEYMLTRREALYHHLTGLLLAGASITDLSRLGDDRLDRPASHHSQHPTEHTLEHLPTRSGRTERARPGVEAPFFHDPISPGWRGTELPCGHGREWYDEG
jgi:hypothetical protein